MMVGNHGLRIMTVWNSTLSTCRAVRILEACQLGGTREIPAVAFAQSRLVADRDVQLYVSRMQKETSTPGIFRARYVMRCHDSRSDN